MGSVLKKRVASGEPRRTPGQASEDAWMAPFPGIWEMLTAGAFADGEARKGATLLLFVDEGVVKACLNDREQGMTAWASGAGLSDCLTALEEGLQGDTLVWRSGGKRPGQKGRK